MAKTRKKTRAKRGKTAPARKRRWAGRLWRLFLLALGLFLGLLVPWFAYLNYQVTTEFEGRKWDLPSRVYARALEVYPGALLTPGDLRVELETAGYREVPSASQPGQFSFTGGTVDIWRRSFRFQEGAEGEQHVRLRLSGQSVKSVEAVSNGQELGLFRLEPAEIASIYPLQKEDRTLVGIARVPTLLVTGLQAVEDRNFKHHHGIDPRGIARAMLANLKAGRAVQGGSTLTQQLVKNYFLSRERTLLRKANEAIMAVLLEYHYGKAEILEAYLNEVFLGQQGAYAVHGFGRASEFYFDEPVEQLEPHQVALLVGLVKGPSYYNPRRHPVRARERRDLVLNEFAETGLLSRAEADAAAAEDLGVSKSPRTRSTRYLSFVDLVRRQLAMIYAEEDLRTEGLRVFTTLSPSEQEKAQSAVSEGLENLADRGLPKELQAALVLADSASGEVRALVGDREPGRPGFNRAIHGRRQVGSVIKPLVYLLALEHAADYNLLTRIEDAPIALRQPDGSTWSPQNFDRESHGSVSLLEAMTRSYNQATVNLGLQLGVNALVSRVAQLGVNADVEPVPSAFLGAVELTPLEVTQIYQSLANAGYSVPLRSVIAVQTPDGEELIRYPLRLLPQPRREAIGVLNFALTEVVGQGTARALPELMGKSATVAGKTGTTNDRRDSWFVGYTRNRVAAAWVGLDDFSPAGVTGSNAAMRIWARLFRDLPLEPVDLRVPEGAHYLWVDAPSGRLSAEGCPGAIQLPYVEGSEPRDMTACGATAQDGDKESIWKKWFGRDEQ
ncbi:MAG: penicillin-binding protein 1B [Xanthomonadales bacterium]|nr:penicillin-binding protein 1B [Gammaproteobacteria bacterium]MBT8057525.1 penicillin-binding protein 1B [Gammaproteobacteria bacterium]NNL04386.1 penicillin-binding protein 1B [Xanthomonadales bacterium]